MKTNREIVYNTDRALIKKYGMNRRQQSIAHHSTPSFQDMTFEQELTLSQEEHVWQLGDSFFALSQRYYGDPQYWRIIALYNHKPTPFHMEIGETLEIPFPLERVLSFYGFD